MDWRKRLIEDSLPLKEISEQSAREKHITQWHPSLLHRWWARRPLVACRVAIFATLVSAPKDEAERKELHGFLKELCTWEASNDRRIIDKARKYIRKYYPDEPPKVLDMFAGGGAIPLEALRLGCESYAIDLNPVAHLIEICTLVYPQKYGLGPDTEKKRQQSFELGEPKCQLAEDVRKWGNWILEEAKKEIGHLYPKVNGKTPVAYLWARTVKCPNPACGATVPLVHQTWLCKKKEKNIALNMIPIPEEKRVTFKIVKGSKADGSQGTMDRNSSTCPCCRTTISNKYLENEGKAKRFGQQLLAIVCSGNGTGKEYLEVLPEEEKRLEQAEKEIEEKLTEWADKGLTVPNEELPYLRSIFNVKVYGIDYWNELFNPRQLVTLVTFTRLVRSVYSQILTEYDEEYAKSIVTYLAFAADRLASFLTTGCWWQPNGEFAVNIFSRQALPMVWDYAEIVPIANVSGDWDGAIDWITRVIEHESHISTKGIANIGTATFMPFQDSFLDAIVSDPPYYDAVPYADLSDFFYVWLKRSIGDLYPEVFRTPLSPKSQEIVQLAERNPKYKKKTKEFFESEMLKALQEANRILKPDGICVIVYAHKTSSAWETLINALLEAGFVLTGSWPLHTERPGRLRAHESAALASSIFLVCQKRPEDAPVGLYSRVIRELQESVNERLSFFWEQGIRGPDFFVSAIGPAVEVFGKYSQVVKGSGEQVSVAEMLNEVRRLVTDYALKQILRGSELGNVDSATRLYVLWRWAFGSGKVPFDDANRLCQALGVESTMLMSKGGLLKKQGDSVLLYGSAERLKQKKNLGEPDETGQIPILIDALHRSLSLSGKPLAEYLAELSPHTQRGVWQIAQSLFEVLPDGDEEKKLLASLIASKERTSKAAEEEASGQQTIQQYIEFGGD